MLELTLSLGATVLTLMKLRAIYASVTKKENRNPIDPVAWIIWAILSVVMLAPQIADVGWQWALMLSCANLFVNLTVIWLARKHDMHWPDANGWIMLGIAGLGMVLWAWQKDAAYGLAFCITADATGVWRMIQKVWHNPNPEPPSAWFLGAGASALALVSAALSGEAMVWWYPLYAVVNALSIAVVILARRDTTTSSPLANPAGEAA